MSNAAAAETVAAALRRELLALMRADVRARERWQRDFADAAQARRVQAVDASASRRLAEIVESQGWPGRSLVGEDGAHAAWLIAQHSPDRAFQERCVGLLRAAVEAGEAAAADLAHLVDRVRMHQQRPQLFGTQFVLRNGELVAWPVEEAEKLAERRAWAGLPPYDSESTRLCEQLVGGAGSHEDTDEGSHDEGRL